MKKGSETEIQQGFAEFELCLPQGGACDSWRRGVEEKEHDKRIFGFSVTYPENNTISDVLCE